VNRRDTVAADDSYERSRRVFKTHQILPARPMIYFWVALGSMLGGLARFVLSGFVAHRFGETFPWGTMVINITGSFAIGFFATLTQPGGRFPVGSPGRQFFMTGICGGYTTYSSFSLQTLVLAREGDWLRAGGNAGGTFVLCFLAVWLGHISAVAINALKGS
jgi:CrcB protein